MVQRSRVLPHDATWKIHGSQFFSLKKSRAADQLKGMSLREVSQGRLGQLNHTGLQGTSDVGRFRDGVRWWGGCGSGVVIRGFRVLNGF